MVQEMTETFQEWHLSWKPSSLQIMFCGDLEPKECEMVVADESCALTYKQVTELEVLGGLVTNIHPPW